MLRYNMNLEATKDEFWLRPLLLTNSLQQDDIQ